MLAVDAGGGGIPGGIGTAAFTFLSGEPSLYAFSRDDVENARRNVYQAQESGVVYAVTFVRPELLTPQDFSSLSGNWAWIWDRNASVVGVLDIAEDQRVRQLGGIEDVVEVAVSSTSGRSSSTIVLTQDQVMPDAFALAVTAEVDRLDQIEGG